MGVCLLLRSLRNLSLRIRRLSRRSWELCCGIISLELSNVANACVQSYARAIYTRYIYAVCRGLTIQEEDVATNTASLSILEDIEVTEITALLEKALSILTVQKRKAPSPLLDAIETRILFRKRFLDIASNTATTRERRSSLKICRDLLPKWVATLDMGKETPEAFSTRIQRKLSISVPPRPMVAIDPREAVKSMKAILDDLAEIETLYDYKSPSEIIVFPST